jgi:hypothetical protein
MLALYALSAFLLLASFAAGQSACGAPIDYNTKCSCVSCKEGPFACYTDTSTEWTCAMCNLDIAKMKKAPASDAKALPEGCHSLFHNKKKNLVIDDSML